MPISRRTVLAAAALPALATLTGCAGRSLGTVRVHVIWSGAELAAFREVMAEFTRKRRWQVELLTVGDDIGALLEGQVGRRTRPDVVLLSLSGLALDHAADLAPAAEAVTEAQLQAFPASWRRLVRSRPGSPDLGVWFKIAHKSLLWYRTDYFEEHNLRPPDDVQEWLALNQQLAGLGIPPLAIGAADGWVLTDWFENLLLGLDEGVYRGLAATPAPGQSDRDHAEAAAGRWRHPAVAEALRWLARLCGSGQLLPGGVDRALLMQFQDSLVDVFARDKAAMVAAADFATPVIQQHAASSRQVGVVRFPGQPGRPKPLVLGGDLAVMPAPAQEGGRAVLDWLASPEAARIWARRGGYISPLTAVDTASYGPEFQAYYSSGLLADVRQQGGAPVFDLSDQLTGRLAGADGQGSWRILQDFFVTIGRGTEVEDAIGTAVAQFAAAARGEPAAG
jgi:alpha-glucoside transport system substrate-binding protein